MTTNITASISYRQRQEQQTSKNQNNYLNIEKVELGLRKIYQSPPSGRKLALTWASPLSICRLRHSCTWKGFKILKMES